MRARASFLSLFHTVIFPPVAWHFYMINRASWLLITRTCSVTKNKITGILLSRTFARARVYIFIRDFACEKKGIGTGKITVTSLANTAEYPFQKFIYIRVPAIPLQSRSVLLENTARVLWRKINVAHITLQIHQILSLFFFLARRIYLRLQKKKRFSDTGHFCRARIVKSGSVTNCVIAIVIVLWFFRELLIKSFFQISINIYISRK